MKRLFFLPLLLFLLNLCIKAFPLNISEYIKAINLMNSGEYTEAISILEKIKEQETNIPAEIFQKLGEAWIKAGVYNMTNSFLAFKKAEETLVTGKEKYPKDENILKNLALLYKVQKRYEDFEEVLKDLLVLNYQGPEVLYELAEIFFDKGYLRIGVGLMEPVVEKNPNPELLYRLAWAYIYFENYRKALEKLNFIEQLKDQIDEKDYRKVVLLKGYMYYELQELQELKYTLEELKYPKDNVEADLFIRNYVLEGDYQKALNIGKDLLESTNTNYIYMALKALNAGNTNKALEYLKNDIYTNKPNWASLKLAEKISTNSIEKFVIKLSIIDLLLSRGYTNESLNMLKELYDSYTGEFREEIEKRLANIILDSHDQQNYKWILQKAIEKELNGGDIAFWETSKAIVALMLGDYDTVREIAIKYIKTQPSQYPYLLAFLLGASIKTEEDKQLLKEYLKDLKAKDPEAFWPYWIESLYYYNEGDMEKAEENIEKAVFIEKNSEEVLYTYALIKSENEESLRDALIFAVALYNQYPDNAYVALAMGNCSLKLGLLDLAENTLEKGLKNLKSTESELKGEFLLRLGDVYNAKKQKGRALEYWLKSVVYGAKAEEINKRIKIK